MSTRNYLSVGTPSKRSDISPWVAMTCWKLLDSGQGLESTLTLYAWTPVDLTSYRSWSGDNSYCVREQNKTLSWEEGVLVSWGKIWQYFILHFYEIFKNNKITIRVDFERYKVDKSSLAWSEKALPDLIVISTQSFVHSDAAWGMDQVSVSLWDAASEEKSTGPCPLGPQ